MEFDDFQSRNPKPTLMATESDLEDAAASDGNLEDRREVEHGSHVQTTTARWLQAACSRSVDFLGR